MAWIAPFQNWPPTIWPAQLALFIAGVLLTQLVAQPAHAQSWGCYDPKPGHPTNAERETFIQEASNAAVRAEHLHGTPAAAIAAMAIVESGYGWTRTSLKAKNYFGWKYVSAAAAGTHGYYTLSCQPAEDVNNHYVKFSSLSDAMDFVSSKLASLPAYKSDTQAYQKARQGGADPVAAVDAWIVGIAEPYNWKPQQYATSIKRFMNNPTTPSDTLSAQTNLYRLSAGIGYAPPGPAATDSEVPPGYSYALKNIHPWSGKCDSPAIMNYSHWEGFPVRRCSYSDIGATVKTYMLNADGNKIAMWFATACQDAKVMNVEGCINQLIKETSEASSMGVFPVAGFIPEPELGGRCFLFRDGVTVHTASYPQHLPPKNGGCGPDSVNDEPITSALRYGRISSTTREDYVDAGGAEIVGGLGDIRWADVVRKLYQQAWNSPRNQLISARAIADRKSGIIK